MYPIPKDKPHHYATRIYTGITYFLISVTYTFNDVTYPSAL